MINNSQSIVRMNKDVENTSISKKSIYNNTTKKIGGTSFTNKEESEKEIIRSSINRILHLPPLKSNCDDENKNIKKNNTISLSLHEHNFSNERSVTHNSDSNNNNNNSNNSILKQVKKLKKSRNTTAALCMSLSDFHNVSNNDPRVSIFLYIKYIRII
jgi:hypothetical protein